LLLPHFCTYFLLQTVVFVDRDARIVLAPGAGNPSYVTVTFSSILVLTVILIGDGVVEKSLPRGNQYGEHQNRKRELKSVTKISIFGDDAREEKIINKQRSCS